MQGRYNKNEVDDINVPFLEIYNILTVLGASKQIITSRYCLEQDIMQIPLFGISFIYFIAILN